jgi:Ankyrin repeats (many copies)
MPPSTQLASSPAPAQSRKETSAVSVIERAIAMGQFPALVDRLDAAVVRQAQIQRLGLVHAAMSLVDVGQRNRTMSALVNLGVDVNALNVHRRTPLHDAVERYDLDGMDVLMGLGADLNAQDGTGKTPLHLSAQKGRIRPATRLISAGASAMVRDDDGKLFTDLGDESFVEHMELLMDVRKTMRILDVAMERHAGVPIPESRDPHDRHEAHSDGWLVSGD